MGGRENDGQNAHVLNALREPVVVLPLTKDYNDTKSNFQHSAMNAPMVPKIKAMGPAQPLLAVIRIHE